MLLVQRIAFVHRIASAKSAGDLRIGVKYGDFIEAENAIPDGIALSPPIDVACRSLPRPPITNFAAARTFRFPAPPPNNPADGRNELVSCSTAFTTVGVRSGSSCTSNATAPLVTAVAMLVPDS